MIGLRFWRRHLAFPVQTAGFDSDFDLFLLGCSWLLRFWFRSMWIMFVFVCDGVVVWMKSRRWSIDALQTMVVPIFVKSLFFSVGVKFIGWDLDWRWWSPVWSHGDGYIEGGSLNDSAPGSNKFRWSPFSSGEVYPWWCRWWHGVSFRHVSSVFCAYNKCGRASVGVCGFFGPMFWTLISRVCLWICVVAGRLLFVGFFVLLIFV